jgi:predicted GIY-YIG superfamily endonuclease
MTAHYVYRVFDDTDRLIYVGASGDPFRRLDQHHTSSWWAYQLARVSMRVYPDKDAARIHEAASIGAEHPRWNRLGLPPRATWTRENYEDHIVSGIAARVRWYESQLWREEAAEYEERFGEVVPIDSLVMIAEQHLERAARHQITYREHMTTARHNRRLALVLDFPKRRRAS